MNKKEQLTLEALRLITEMRLITETVKDQGENALEALRDWAASPGNDIDHANLRLRVDAYLKAYDAMLEIESMQRLIEIEAAKAEQDKRGLKNE